MKSIKNFSQWLILPNDLFSQLSDNEELGDRSEPKLAKAIEDKLQEWREKAPSPDIKALERNQIKAELWRLLSAYETETGMTFYQ
jgi:hypothetical protein